MDIAKLILSLTLLVGVGFGGLANAEMTLQMADAHNPCAMNDASNPCNKKQHNPCNPCGMKHDNPCGMKKPNPCNPCNMKNPCDMKNPCSAKAGDAVDPELIKRPTGTALYAKKSQKKLVKMGKSLFKDTSLSSNGLSCNSCHETNHLFNKSFSTPYPHKVSMAKQRAGLDVVDADEFVQFCMLVPMESETLAWDSKELAALTAYVKEVKQKDFVRMVQANPCHFKHKPMAEANPCGMKNPCAAKNPCHMKNPCGAKNPCATKNPCAKNPCSM